MIYDEYTTASNIISKYWFQGWMGGFIHFEKSLFFCGLHTSKLGTTTVLSTCTCVPYRGPVLIYVLQNTIADPRCKFWPADGRLGDGAIKAHKAVACHSNNALRLVLVSVEDTAFSGRAKKKSAYMHYISMLIFFQATA